MANPNRRTSNVAMEQILGNITAPIHHSDGQYIQLGFSPPASPSKLPPNAWSCQGRISTPSFQQYGMDLQDPQTVYSLNHVSQYGAQPNQTNFGNYVHHANVQPERPYNINANNAASYNIFQNQADLTYRTPNYIRNDFNSQPGAGNYFLRGDTTNTITSGPVHPVSNPTQLIENVVGNWVPTTNGTYSPFGNSIPYESSPIDKLPTFEECRDFGPKNTDFRFSRDVTKPRMVAEVKPMRPTYSDVLTKSVPAPIGKTVTAGSKADAKDVKVTKKENKRSSKGEKTSGQKGKPSKLDRSAPTAKTGEKVKCEKPNPLRRKWASLDNVNNGSGGGGGSGSDANEEEPRFTKKAGKKYDESLHSNGFKTDVKNGFFDKMEVMSVDLEDEEAEERSSEAVNVGRLVNRKSGAKVNPKHKGNDTDRNYNNKKSHKGRKKENEIPYGIIGQKIKHYVPRWWNFIVNICLWLFNLITDVCSMSVHLTRDAITNLYNWLSVYWASVNAATAKLIERLKSMNWFKRNTVKKKESIAKEPPKNITMPTTGEEAMKRLLACKGKDPYSILGVTPDCTDEDIKRNYKRQAVLVHPDKNQQPGAEEAFKILVHAFHMIGESDKRAAYNKGVAESAQVEQAWSELTELLAQLQKKVETAATTIRCSACGMRHKRVKIDRPSYAARNCATCKIHHAAKEGDIWAEARWWGFLWHYYASMEGGVYDITEWASCQKDSLKHLRPDSHQVQYRIALGKQTKQTRHPSTSTKNKRPPDLENLLNNLYGNNQESNNVNTKRKNKKSK